MRVSEHLQELHKSASRFHRAMEAAHGAIMEKSEKGTSTHAFHKAAHQAHGEAADAHDELLADCQKAIEASDLQKANSIRPDGIRGTIPPAPTMVPRHGAPTAAAALPMAKASLDQIIPDTQDEGFFV